MTQRQFGPSDRHTFDTIIDVRSPAEYALDHIPGAINCPVLDDDERRTVGTLYVQVSAFEARKLGSAMVARNIARHLDGPVFKDRSKTWRPMLYCWRGGLRSGSFVTWLRLIGWDAQQLHGGYKAWRHHVMTQLEEHVQRLPLRVVAGATGSAKTRVLQALAALGAQVLDLEALAGHRGSVLGAVPGIVQPSQKRFETLVAEQVEGFDPSRPVFVEAESRRIGRISLPDALLMPLRAAPCIEIAASREARLDYLLRDYAFFADDPEGLADKLALLKGLQPNEVLARWHAWALARELRPLFDELIALHYDPLYARSQRQNLHALDAAVRFETNDLGDAGIAALAARIAAQCNALPPRAAIA